MVFFRKISDEVAIHFQTSEQGLIVTSTLNKAPLPLDRPLPGFKGKGNDEARSQARMLCSFLELVDEEKRSTLGLTIVGEGAIVLAWDNLVAGLASETPTLDSPDDESHKDLFCDVCRALVGDFSRVTMALENTGPFNLTNFAIESVFRDQYGSRVFFSDGASGAISDGVLYILNLHQHTLTGELAKPWPDDQIERQRRWSQLKPLAVNAGASWSDFLKGENSVFLDKVTPLISRSEEGVVDIGFELETPYSSEIVSNISAIDKVSSNYTFRGSGRRRDRVFLEEEVRRAVHKIRNLGPLAGDDAARACLDPQSLFPDLNCIDWSEFSDRVLEAGFHVHRPPTFESDAGGLGQWAWDEKTHGAVVTLTFPAVNPGDEEFIYDISSPAVELDLHRRVLAADEEGAAYLEIVPGRFVPLSGFPSRFFRAPEVDKDAEQSTTLVLKPKTNLEELEYGEADQQYKSREEVLPMPTSLRRGIQLRDYQRVGFQRIASVASGLVENASGFLLADDMGLGKTLQILTVLAHLFEYGRQGPHLIVGPVSLLENWRREMEKFFPGVFEEPVEVLSKTPASVLKRAPVSLTSYGRMRSRQFELVKVKWDCIILDEAQKIKNPGTQTTNASWALSARTRIALTGTPVENRLTDLWSITNFFQPGLLGSLKDFRDEYAPSQGETSNLVKLREKLDPLMLRRTKEEVATELASITHEYRPIAMGSTQRELYRREIVAKNEGVRTALETVNRLLQLCTHSSLVDYRPLWPCGPDQCPKLFETFKILDSVKSAGEKAIVFTRFLKAQGCLARALQDKYSLRPSIINGSVAGPKRQPLIDQFSASRGFNVLILSPESAGMGLNITSANHVIHFTRSWNPAIERQATDRAYRIGQEKPVTVYYPMIVDRQNSTIEERLDHLLQEKMRLFRDIFAPPEQRHISANELLADLQ